VLCCGESKTIKEPALEIFAYDRAPVKSEK
jgi:hypothetical protein